MLLVSNNALISADGGSVTIQNLDGKQGSINFGTGATVKGSSTVANVGNVTIHVGTTLTQTVGVAPQNVVTSITGSGKIFFGKNSIVALSPNNTLKALGRNITFDTTTGSPTSIQLSGGVAITADPPPGSREGASFSRSLGDDRAADNAKNDID